MEGIESKSYAGASHALPGKSFERHSLWVFISGQKRAIQGAIKRELRRRSTVEPVIGHRKSDVHLGRNVFEGRHGPTKAVKLLFARNSLISVRSGIDFVKCVAPRLCDNIA